MEELGHDIGQGIPAGRGDGGFYRYRVAIAGGGMVLYTAYTGAQIFEIRKLYHAFLAYIMSHRVITCFFYHISCPSCFSSIYHGHQKS
jgi:hypothetical protein